MKDKDIIARIADTRTWPTELFYRTHEETIAKCMYWLDYTGRFVKTKAAGAVSPDTGTAVPGGVLLPADWETRSDQAKAEILLHEIMHLRDAEYIAVVKRYGVRWWLRLLTRPWWLVIYECRGYILAYAYRMYQGGSLERQIGNVRTLPGHLLRSWPQLKILVATKRRRARFDRVILAAGEKVLTRYARNGYVSI